MTNYNSTKEITDDDLYGESKECDASRELQQGADTPKYPHTVESPRNIAALIIAPRKVAIPFAKNYNYKQQQLIKDRTYIHQVLCERKHKIGGYLFLKYKDFLPKDFTPKSAKELSINVANQMKKILEAQLPWLITYSKFILREYYDVNPHLLKIIPNFIIDDNTHLLNDENNRGGLLFNGLLDELKYYENKYGDVGMLCQVQIPTGIPKYKKWSQIDIGVTLYGRRNIYETSSEAILREAKILNLCFHQSIIEKLDSPSHYQKLRYLGSKNKDIRDACLVYVIEILYQDGISILEDPPNYDFCKCDERNNIINI